MLKEGKDEDAEFDQQLARFSGRDTGQIRIGLQWLAFAAQPLHTSELAELFAVLQSQDDQQPDTIVNSALLDSRLVVVNDKEDEVHVANSLLRDYLVSSRIHNTASAGYAFEPTEAHFNIATTCLKYLLSFRPSEGKSAEDSKAHNPLLDYSAHCWYVHARHVTLDTARGEFWRQLRPLTFQLLNSRNGSCFENWLRVNRPDGYGRLLPESSDEFGSLLYYAAACGLADVVSVLIAQGHSARTRAEHVPGCSYAGPLEVAVEKGFADVVSVLLQAGARPNLWMEIGGTCLTRAARRGHEDVVRLLLEHGTSVGVRLGDGSTALHLAAHQGSAAVIKLLIEYGTEVDARSDIGTTALHEAVTQGQEDAVKALLEAGADRDATTTDSMRVVREDLLDLITIAKEQDRFASREIQDAHEKTPLYIAADSNQHTIARLLIAHGAQVDLTTNLGATALHVATFRGHVEMVNLLLESGADASKRTKSGATTLHLAAESKVPELVEIMLSQGVDADILDDWNDTAIVRAIGPRGSLGVLQRFVQLGVSPNLVNKVTKTPMLQMAVLLGHETIVRYLLDQNVDVDAVNLQGATALHHAVNHGFVEIMRLLLLKGANINAVMSERSLSVLHMTVMGESKAALECLLTWPMKPDTEARDDRGYTALHYAVLQPSKELSELLLRHGANPNVFGEGDTTPLEKAVREQPEMVPLLIEYGADAALKRPDGLFVLMIATYEDDSEMVEQLMKNQKSIDPLFEALKESTGLVTEWTKWDDAGKLLPWAILNGQEILTWIILHYSSLSADTKLPPNNSNMLVIATHFQHHGIVKLLLRRGATVDGTDSTGMKAIHIAAEHGNLDIAKTLIEHGCDINDPGDGRGTPLTWALRNKHDAVVRLLCQHGADIAAEEKRLDMTVSIGPKQIFYGVKEDTADPDK